MPAPAASPPDFVVSGGGTVYLVRPTNDEARAHLEENVSEDAQWFGGALAVEHRYIAGLLEGLTSAGFSVGAGW